MTEDSKWQKAGGLADEKKIVCVNTMFGNVDFDDGML